MDLAPFRIRFHEAAQPCTSLVTPHDIKTDKYKCAKGHEWQPSDVSKTLCVHVLDDKNRVVSLPQITRYVIDDGDDDEEEEDEDDEDEEGDEDEDENRSRKEGGKRGKSDQKKASKRVDDDASDDEDDDDDGNNEKQPRYLFVAFCSKRHASPLMHLKDAFVRIDRPHCQSIKDVVAFLVKKIRDHKSDFAFDLTKDRMQFHRMDDKDCKGDLNFKTLLSDHTVPTTTPDQHLWGKKVVRLHVERQSGSSAEKKEASKAASSFGKPGGRRPTSNPRGHDNGSSGGREARREGGNHSAAGGNDSEGGGQGSKSEERSRYLVFVSCPQVHSWLSLKLKKTWVKVDPPFVGWGQNGVLGELRRRVGGSDLPTLPAGDRAILSIHPLDQCENQLTLQMAMRDYSVQSAGAGVPFDQSKRLFVHFAKPPAGQPPTQGSSTVITSASQSSQSPKKRASPVNTSSKGGDDVGKSGPVAKRPRITGDEGSREENNNARRPPGTDKARTGDAQKARWLVVHICGQHHRHAPPGVKGAIVRLRIDPESCGNLQDVGSQVAEVIEGQYGSFGYNSAVHAARFFANGDLKCVDSLDVERLLRVHTTISRPADEEIQSGGAKRKTAVKIHFDGDPKVFRNEEQAKGAERQSTSGKAKKRKVDNEDEDDTDGPVEKVGPRKRQSNSTSGPPAKRTKVTGGPRSNATEEEDADADADQTEQDAPDDNDGPNGTESEGGDPEWNDAELSDAESLEAADDNGDIDIFNVPFSSLDGRAIVRIGVLETPDVARTPTNDALPMRTVVVAMVEKVKNRLWPITLISIDSWKIMDIRVGDYPSGDPWRLEDRNNHPRFTPDRHWEPYCTDMAALRKALRTYVRGGRARRDQEVSDNDSDRSTSRREGKPVANRPRQPVKAPLRPHPTRKNNLQKEWTDGLSTYYDNWNPGERIDAVICFVNTSAKTELETHRNFQASMPPTQSLTAFRRYIKNTRFNNTKGTLKHILRDVSLDWWCDFQVWLTPMRRGTIGLDPTKAYCWDEVENQHFEIGDFLHPDNITNLGVAQVFIEIRIVRDPQHARKQRAWVGHNRRYRNGRTPTYGWKTQARGLGRCILDDVEDFGHIADDNQARTYPP